MTNARFRLTAMMNRPGRAIHRLAFKKRLFSCLADLLLDGFCLFLPADDGPGIAVSTFAELAQALGPADPLPASALEAQPARVPTSVMRAASRCAVFLLAACLTIPLALHAQVPVFEEMPDGTLRYVTAANDRIPARASFEIAVIETNAPSYRGSADKPMRYYRINRLIELEDELLKPSPDLQGYWYDFLEAKAPELTEDEIEAIARDWWAANRFRAAKHDGRYGLRDATLKEVRAHLLIFRTGNEVQVAAAKQWLMMAQMDGTLDSLAIPPQMRALSPLAHLLARDISEEARLYGGPEAVKMRNTVKRLIVGKLTVEGETGIQHTVLESDIDALLEKFSSDSEERSHAQEALEEWLKQAIDADITQIQMKGREL
jgi:hypothetical protein